MTPGELYGLYIFLVLLAGGVYLAMPAERPAALAQRLFVVGFLVTAGGLTGLGFYFVRWIGAGFEGRVFFVIFALLAIAAAVRVVTHHRPVYSAVYLVLVVLATTGLCVLAGAEFLSAALVIVYGGAILVTYIFVIMLAQQAGEAPYDVRSREPFAAVLLSFALLAATTQAMVAIDPIAEHAAKARRSVSKAAMVQPGDAGAAAAASDKPGGEDIGNVRMVGRLLMGRYMIAVQVAGILMLVAMAGAIAVARKRIEHEYHTPFEELQSQLRPRTVGRNVEPFVKVEPGEHR